MESVDASDLVNEGRTEWDQIVFFRSILIVRINNDRARGLVRYEALVCLFHLVVNLVCRKRGTFAVILSFNYSGIASRAFLNCKSFEADNNSLSPNKVLTDLEIG